MSLGSAIKTCRQNKKMTRANLAKSAHVSVSYLSLLENNNRDPNFSKLEAISKGLGIPVTVLMFLAKDRHEIESINPELAEKLSLIALKLIEPSSDERTLLHSQLNF